MKFFLKDRGKLPTEELLTIYARLSGAHAHQMRKLVKGSSMTAGAIVRQMVMHCLDDLKRK